MRAPAAPGKPDGEKKTAPAAPRERAVVEDPTPEGGKPPKDIWNDALKLLKRTDPAIFGPLSQGKYGGYQDGVFRALFPKEMDFMLAMLSSPERRSRVEEALSKSGGAQAKFEALPLEAPPDLEKEKRREKNLNGLVDMFGRDKVQIDD